MPGWGRCASFPAGGLPTRDDTTHNGGCADVTEPRHQRQPRGFKLGIETSESGWEVVDLAYESEV